MSYINKEELIRRMQVGAPMNWTDDDYERGEVSQYNHDMQVIESCSKVKMIPIPPKTTNGDMIKAMFPDAKVNTTKYSYVVEVKLPYHTEHDTGLLFDKDWWNAPYKER